MEHILGQGWEIIPAGGATGEAFQAINKDQKLFLKRNSSPFLAVLSAEGIVPKLIWTKRLESGDVITAQRWLDGRELRQSEMNQEIVAHLLRKIHQSVPLLMMLKRIGKTRLDPAHLYEEILVSLDEELRADKRIDAALGYFRDFLPQVEGQEAVVCHCDINHNNWLLSEEEQLYLVDWDGAMIADPAIDLGMLLYTYVSKAEWGTWLANYGIKLTESLETRMKWYAISQCLISINWCKKKGQSNELEHWLHYLSDTVLD
ncbi:MAG: phosphotransferase [Bacillus sp. (in: firmicutes)]